MFQFFKFYLSALPSLSPVSSEHSHLFLFWPTSLLHHSPLWCSDLTRGKEHHLDLEVYILIASLHVWLFCQQIESSYSFISYNFNNSLQPDDVVEHIYIYRDATAPGSIFCPGGRTVVLMIHSGGHSASFQLPICKATCFVYLIFLYMWGLPVFFFTLSEGKQEKGWSDWA
jgi:hypothetical protein